MPKGLTTYRLRPPDELAVIPLPHPSWDRPQPDERAASVPASEFWRRLGL